jgi:LPXTG-site transpeptidase (sortase) family protein
MNRRSARARARPLAFAALALLTALHLVAALTFLFLLTTVPPDLDLQTGPRSSAPAPQPAGSLPAPGAADPQGVAAVPGSAQSLRATELEIPALDIHQYLLELGVDPTGVLQPPVRPDVAGWFSGAAAPGEAGPTVIAGHVDSTSGPGVFYDLKDLVRGDRVVLRRSDGQTATYRVTSVLSVDKDRFPTQQVYGPTPAPELRLITCGGTFDRATGHYLRNVVVSGVLADGP